MSRAAQDSCGQVVDQVGGSSGAVQQPGSHILEALGQAGASGPAGLLHPPPESPASMNEEAVSKQMLNMFMATMCE